MSAKNKKKKVRERRKHIEANLETHSDVTQLQTSLLPKQSAIYLLYALLPMVAFYFLFRDFRVFDFFLNLIREHTTLVGFEYYEWAYIFSLAPLLLLYYGFSVPVIEDCLSFGVMNKYLLSSLQDMRAHEFVHFILYGCLFLVRAFSMWLGSDFGVGLYFVIWGSAIGSFVSRILSFKPFSNDEASYSLSKTALVRTGIFSPHAKAIIRPTIAVIFGELILFVIHTLA